MHVACKSTKSRVLINQLCGLLHVARSLQHNGHVSWRIWSCSSQHISCAYVLNTFLSYARTYWHFWWTRLDPACDSYTSSLHLFYWISMNKVSADLNCHKLKLEFCDYSSHSHIVHFADLEKICQKPGRTMYNMSPTRITNKKDLNARILVVEACTEWKQKVLWTQFTSLSENGAVIHETTRMAKDQRPPKKHRYRYLLGW